MEEEVDSKKSKSSTEKPLSPPWLDLPDPITELILENLTLPDYLRFAAVCQKWRSIQRNHRFRYSPSQPPMCPDLPWFTHALQWGKDSKFHCYSPFSETEYDLHGVGTFNAHYIFCCHGWILYASSDPPYLFTLTNPITTVEINLPFLPLPEDEEFSLDRSSGAMSGPPSDPDCSVLLVDGYDVYLYRVNHDEDCWTHLDLPLPTKPLPCPDVERSTAVFSGGSFYCFSRYNCLYAVNPALPDPSVTILEMDTSCFPWQQWDNFLVDLNGEVLLVVQPFKASDSEPDFLRFQVFRPDFSKKMWVRVNDIGGRTLFIHYYCCFSLSAADVGCKKNCIYYPTAYLPPRRKNALRDYLEVFDLETGELIDEGPHVTEDDSSQFVGASEIWFLPRLDHVGS